MKTEEEKKLIKKNWRDKNREKIKLYHKMWSDKNREKSKSINTAARKKFRSNEDNYKKHLSYNNKYLEEYNKKKEIKEMKNIWMKDWLSKPENRERIKALRKTPEYKARKQERHKERMAEDKIYNLISRLRKSLSSPFSKGYIKSDTTTKLVGCSLLNLKMHLEKQFKQGMSWDNYGKWHIDHIIPVNYFKKNFDFNKKETQKECFHYANLQPLWASENIKKSDKY